MLTFGERLRMARLRAGFTQQDVYKKINLNNKSLSRYENNATSPDPDTVKDLIILYDVPADFILGLSDEMERTKPLYSVLNSKNSYDMFKSKVKVTGTTSSKNKEILKMLETLSPKSKEKAIDYIKMLKTLDKVKSDEN